MTSAEQVHRAMFDAIMAHDLESFTALYDPDGLYRFADGEIEEREERGWATMEMYFAALSDISIEIEHLHSPSDDVSIAEVRATATHDGADLIDPGTGLPIPASGRQLNLHMCNIIEVRDGKVWMEREYINTATYGRQLLPQPDLQERSASITELGLHLSEMVRTHDGEGCAACYAQDAEVTAPSENGQTVVARGRAEIKAFFEGWFGAFDDYDIQDVLLENGDRLMTQGAWSITHTGPLQLPTGESLEPTGRRVTINAMESLVFEGELIKSHRMYFDPESVMSQLTD